jgi:aminodeoxyfutalosine synthase
MIGGVPAVSDEELSALASSHDIITLGMLADEARRERHGAKTTFLRVAEVPASPGTTTTWPETAGEVRIVGRPESLALAVARVKEVAASNAGNGVARDVPLSGFSLADLEELAAQERLTLRALLETLRAAGLELVAEAPVDRLQDARRSIEDVNIAGLALSRLTIHQWPAAEDQPAELQRLFRNINALQRSVAVIRTFAPLPRAFNPAAPSTGYEDIKRVALARLFVDAIASIQVDWVLYGPKLAQVALTVGADDVDNVPAADDESLGIRRSTLEEVRRNIRAAGFDPVERGGRFDRVHATA